MNHVYLRTDWQGYEVEARRKDRTCVPALSFPFDGDVAKAIASFDELTGDYLLNFVRSGEKRMALPFWVARVFFLRMLPHFGSGKVYVRISNPASPAPH